ncbi:MAG: FMN-binding negative transcriptional regulator [Jatrophihabitans sp.]
MYVPNFNAIDDDAAIREMVAAIGTAEFVTVGCDGYPQATLLPIMWHENTVIAHLARANPQWRGITDDQPALLICGGAQSYVSPAWYAAKAEHGRVVPTWNYSSVHLRGTVRVHHEIEWLRCAVTELTERQENGRAAPWQVSDAPAAFITGQLHGIVGLEITLERVTGKAKLSQNRSVTDRQGVIDGLRNESGDAAVAEAMAKQL